MIAQPQEAASRHNALLEAGQEIARLNAEIETLTISRNAHNRRAERAEEVVRELESQLTHPVQETITLVQELLPRDVRLKADAELVEYINANWTVASEIVNTIESANGKLPLTVQHIRIVRFIRTAPIEPAPDFVGTRRALSADEAAPVLVAEPSPEYPADPAAYAPAHSSIAGLWNALYDLTRFGEYVQHWAQLPHYAPRVYAVLEGAGCNMTGAKIMKSFKPSRVHDEWTMTVLFPKSSQIAKGTGDALEQAGFTSVIARDGRQFIFDLPQAWITPPKTVKADAVFEASLTPDEPARNFGLIATDRAALSVMAADELVDTKTFTHLVMNSRLPRSEQTELLNSRLIQAGQNAFDRRPYPARSYPSFGVQS